MSQTILKDAENVLASIKDKIHHNSYNKLFRDLMALKEMSNPKKKAANFHAKINKLKDLPMREKRSIENVVNKEN